MDGKYSNIKMSQLYNKAIKNLLHNFIAVHTKEREDNMDKELVFVAAAMSYAS